MSRLAEHNFRARGPAARGVCRKVLWTHIGFGLDDTTDANSPTVGMHEVHADKITSDVERAWSVEAAGKFAASSIHGRAWYQRVCLLRALARKDRNLATNARTSRPCWAYLVFDELVCATRTSFLTLFTPSTARISSSASFASAGVLATPVKVTFP